MADQGTLDVGDIWPLGITVKDSAGVAANASSVTLTITLPDGTTAPGTTPSNPATGQYTYDYVTVQEGLHKAHWVTAGPAAVFTDQADVRVFRSIVSLAAARQHLNLTSTVNDEELRRKLETATEVVESFVGPCVVRTFTERVSTSDGYTVLLSNTPVLSVTSLTAAYSTGTSYVTGDLVVDADAGIVSPSSLSPLVGGPWTVTYTAGRRQVPSRYVDAALEMAKHLWETQRGGSATPRVGGAMADDEVRRFGFGFSVPRRVVELLERDTVPGVA